MHGYVFARFLRISTSPLHSSSHLSTIFPPSLQTMLANPLTSDARSESDDIVSIEESTILDEIEDFVCLTELCSARCAACRLLFSAISSSFFITQDSSGFSLASTIRS